MGNTSSEANSTDGPGDAKNLPSTEITVSGSTTAPKHVSTTFKPPHSTPVVGAIDPNKVLDLTESDMTRSTAMETIIIPQQPKTTPKKSIIPSALAPATESSTVSTPYDLSTDYLHDDAPLVEMAKTKFRGKDVLIQRFGELIRELRELPHDKVTPQLMLEYNQRLLEDPDVKQEMGEKRGKNQDHVKAGCYAIVLRQYLLNQQVPLPSEEELYQQCPFLSDPDDPLHFTTQPGERETVVTTGRYHKVDSMPHLLGFLRAIQGFMQIGLSVTGNKNAFLWAGGVLEGSGTAYTTGGNATVVTQRREKMIEKITGIDKKKKITIDVSALSNTPNPPPMSVMSDDDSEMSVEVAEEVSAPRSAVKRPRDDGSEGASEKASTLKRTKSMERSAAATLASMPVFGQLDLSAPSIDLEPITMHPSHQSLAMLSAVAATHTSNLPVVPAQPEPESAAPSTTDNANQEQHVAFPININYLEVKEHFIHAADKAFKGRHGINPITDEDGQTNNNTAQLAMSIFMKAFDDVEQMSISEFTIDLLMNYKRRWFDDSNSHILWQELSKLKRIEATKAIFYAMIIRQYILNKKIPLMSIHDAMMSLPITYHEYFDAKVLRSKYLPGFIRTVYAMKEIGIPIDRNRNTFLAVGGLLEGSFTRYVVTGTPGVHIQHRLDILKHICPDLLPIPTSSSGSMTTSGGKSTKPDNDKTTPLIDYLQDSNMLIQIAMKIFRDQDLMTFRSAVEEVSQLPVSELTLDLMENFKTRWLKDRDRWQAIMKDNHAKPAKALYYAMILRQYMVHHIDEFRLKSFDDIVSELSDGTGDQLRAAADSLSTTTGIHANSRIHEYHLSGFIRAIQGLRAMNIPIERNKETFLFVGGILEGSGNLYWLSSNPSLAIRIRLDIIRYIVGEGDSDPMIVSEGNESKEDKKDDKKETTKISASSAGIMGKKGVAKESKDVHGIVSADVEVNEVVEPSDEDVLKSFIDIEAKLAACMKLHIDRSFRLGFDGFERTTALMTAATAVKQACDKFKCMLQEDCSK